MTTNILNKIIEMVIYEPSTIFIILGVAYCIFDRKFGIREA